MRAAEIIGIADIRLIKIIRFPVVRLPVSCASRAMIIIRTVARAGCRSVLQIVLSGTEIAEFLRTVGISGSENARIILSAAGSIASAVLSSLLLLHPLIIIQMLFLLPAAAAVFLIAHIIIRHADILI